MLDSKDYNRFFSDGIPYGKWDNVRKEEFDDLCSLMKPGFQLRFDATVECGVPAGRDALHEFALKPCHHFETLAEEIRTLRLAGMF